MQNFYEGENQKQMTEKQLLLNTIEEVLQIAYWQQVFLRDLVKAIGVDVSAIHTDSVLGQQDITRLLVHFIHNIASVYGNTGELTPEFEEQVLAQIDATTLANLSKQAEKLFLFATDC